LRPWYLAWNFLAVDLIVAGKDGVEVAFRVYLEVIGFVGISLTTTGNMKIVLPILACP